jgi:hypothetical protein
MGASSKDNFTMPFRRAKMWRPETELIYSLIQSVSLQIKDLAKNDGNRKYSASLGNHAGAAA